MMAIKTVFKTLFEPIDIASLVVFRVLFGLLMSISMVRFVSQRLGGDALPPADVFFHLPWL